MTNEETQKQEKRSNIEIVKRRPGCCLIITVGLVLIIILLLFGIPFTSRLPSSGLPSVAVLPISGAITDVTELVEVLHTYAEDSHIKALVLQINSPGGVVGAVQELYSEILKVKKERDIPVIASFGSVAASGGYYIACAADEILSNPGTLTGSIGVIMTVPNWEELIRKIGMEFQVVKSGEFKDIASPARPMTDEERELLSSVIDDVYNQFYETVYTARADAVRKSIEKEKMNTMDDSPTTVTVKEQEIKERLKTLADGRIFSGRQAMNYGLVDQKGTLYDAITRAAERAGMRKKPHIVKPKKKWQIRDILFGNVSSIGHLPLSDTPKLEYRLVIK